MIILRMQQLKKCMQQVPSLGVKGNQVKNLNGPATVSDELGPIMATG